MNFLNKLAQLIVWTLLIYGFGSFCAWSTDIGEWSAFGRIVAGFFEFCFLAKFLTETTE
jgi:hypothetical protein